MRILAFTATSIGVILGLIGVVDGFTRPDGVNALAGIGLLIVALSFWGWAENRTK